MSQRLDVLKMFASDLINALLYLAVRAAPQIDSGTVSNNWWASTFL